MYIECKNGVEGHERYKPLYSLNAMLASRRGSYHKTTKARLPITVQGLRTRMAPERCHRTIPWSQEHTRDGFRKNMASCAAVSLPWWRTNRYRIGSFDHLARPGPDESALAPQNGFRDRLRLD